MFEGLGWLMGVACVAMMALMCVPMVVGMFKQSKNLQSREEQRDVADPFS